MSRRIVWQLVGLAAIVRESSGIPPAIMPTPTVFSMCSDVNTHETLWAFNDFSNRKIHIMPSWQVQSFIDKKYGIKRSAQKNYTFDDED
jgi:hypothetical protein